ncbi:MAG: hypothetical protein RI894_588 [Bacteroidota bacterium]|jgi:heptose-I-phosphate ethanolaminephosphotransferase
MQLNNLFKQAIENKTRQICIYFLLFILPFLTWELAMNQFIGAKVFLLIVLYGIANGLLFGLLGMLLSMLWQPLSKLYTALFFIAAYPLFLVVFLCKWVLKIPFSVLVLNTLFDATFAEVFEFVSSHASLKIVFIAFLMLIAIVGVLYYFIKIVENFSRISRPQKTAISIGIALFYGGCIWQNDLLYTKNMFNEVKTAYKDYQAEKDFLKHGSYDYLSNIQQVKSYKLSSDTTSKVFVLVIGESHSRNHASLYGYARNTNPLLTKRKDELFIFDDVISPAATTVRSLQKVLSFATLKQPELLYSQPSLLDIFNNIGYKTWWISNQQVSGQHDTWSKLYAQKATEKCFINTTNSWLNYSFDENIIPYFEAALKDKAKNKLIVLHLIGSHERADKRYTEKFNTFTETTNLPTASANLPADNKNYINFYDNSVRYNDFVLATLIAKLEATNQKACFLYLSDHGEEVCEKTDYHGHIDGATSTYMFEIPLLLWMSPSYNKAEFLKKNPQITHRPFQTDQLLSSILDLTNVRTEQYDSTKSLFSPYFIPSKRYINFCDYDSIRNVNLLSNSSLHL